jgi:hypothetical protein
MVNRPEVVSTSGGMNDHAVPTKTDTTTQRGVPVQVITYEKHGAYASFTVEAIPSGLSSGGFVDGRITHITIRE